MLLFFDALGACRLWFNDPQSLEGSLSRSNCYVILIKPGWRTHLRTKSELQNELGMDPGVRAYATEYQCTCLGAREIEYPTNFPMFARKTKKIASARLRTQKTPESFSLSPQKTRMSRDPECICEENGWRRRIFNSILSFNLRFTRDMFNAWTTNPEAGKIVAAFANGT